MQRFTHPEGFFGLSYAEQKNKKWYRRHAERPAGIKGLNGSGAVVTLALCGWHGSGEDLHTQEARVCVCVSTCSFSSAVQCQLPSLFCFHVVPPEDRRVSENNENTDLSLSLALSLYYLECETGEGKSDKALFVIIAHTSAL